jgi:NADH-quinone oxidoreductase subunit F
MSDNLSKLLGRSGIHDDLFNRLAQVARDGGTREAEDRSSQVTLPIFEQAVGYGAASFYDLTKAENQGIKVHVCNGSVCRLNGGQVQLREVLKGYFSEDQIGTLTCLGRCHENRAFQIQGVNYSGPTADQIDAIVKGTVGGQLDSYTVSTDLSEPILTAAPIDVEQCGVILHGLIKQAPQQVLDEIQASGLRGRGGAGFPMGFKLNACRQAKGKRRYIVCNADEGDPGAYSDRYLLEKQPHRVLLGMIIAGWVVGAETGVVYIRAEYPESVAVVRHVVEELEEQGLCGQRLFGSEFSFEFKVIKAGGSYICGEETALLSSIEGRRPEVRVRPPYPVESGLFGLPTVVSNVETLASLPFIIERGGEAFAGYGTDKSTGTKLVSLDGLFVRPGVYEVAMGQRLDVVINDLGGGFRSPVKALHIGGPLGGLVPQEKFDALTIDFESFAEAGFLLGHAGVVSIPQDWPMIDYLRHLFEFVADESCGKCFPCRLGSVRGEELLADAADKGRPIDPRLFDDLLMTLELSSACALGGGLPLPIRNAMRYFSEELAVCFKGATHE